MTIGSYAVTTGVVKPVGPGWQTLPLGCGGLVTGFHMAADDSLVCRSDVGNTYIWSGTTSDIDDPDAKWLPLLTLDSFSGITDAPKSGYSAWGATEIVLAPSDSTKIWMICPTVTGGSTGTVYYSTNSGDTWTASNLSSSNCNPNTPDATDGIEVKYNKNAYHRIAVDPNNSDVVYVGLPPVNEQDYAVYFADDGHTFSGISDLGQVSLDTKNTNSGANGICFDSSSGTTTVSSQTRTSRIIIPVPGSDIYESVDGGQTWSSTGFASTYGSTDFSINCAVVNSNGTYFCSINSSTPNAGDGSVYRYMDGTWTSIKPATYTVFTQTLLLVDPTDPDYLTITGERGIGYGSTSFNAEDTTPTWSDTTGSDGTIIATAPSYDIGYMNVIPGQGVGSHFFFITNIKMDSNGDTIGSGNQSIWKISGRLEYGGTHTVTLISFGRGMEATVAQEVWKTSTMEYPSIAFQDCGGVSIGGTYDSYPTSMFQQYVEWTGSSIEDSPTNPNFLAVRITGQGAAAGKPYADEGSGYSLDGGKTWTAYATNPVLLWQTQATGSATGDTLTIDSVTSGSPIFIGQEVYTGTNTDHNVYISDFDTGSGDTGTYILSDTLDESHTISSQSLILQAANNGGQICVVDEDHQLIVPAGFSHGTIPVYCTNAKSDTDCGWAVCSGLPYGNWMSGPWFWAVSNKPLAAGQGDDIGTVWAAFKTGTNEVTVYKSTDSGANFSATENTITVSSNMLGTYLLTVPGYPGHLWLTGTYSSAAGGPAGLWQSKDYGDTWTQIGTGPIDLPNYLSIGAIDPQNGTYPTLWLKGDSGDTTPTILIYSINGGQSWDYFGSHGDSGQRADLPPVHSLYGLGSVRADRDKFKQLYCGAGQSGNVVHRP